MVQKAGEHGQRCTNLLQRRMGLEVVDELVEIVGSCPCFASFVRELDLGRLNMRRYFNTMMSLETVSPAKG